VVLRAHPVDRAQYRPPYGRQEVWRGPSDRPCLRHRPPRHRVTRITHTRWACAGVAVRALRGTVTLGQGLQAAAAGPVCPGERRTHHPDRRVASRLSRATAPAGRPPCFSFCVCVCVCVCARARAYAAVTHVPACIRLVSRLPIHRVTPATGRGYCCDYRTAGQHPRTRPGRRGLHRTKTWPRRRMKTTTTRVCCPTGPRCAAVPACAHVPLSVADHPVLCRPWNPRG
jgi:hypothetical protein